MNQQPRTDREKLLTLVKYFDQIDDFSGNKDRTVQKDLLAMADKLDRLTELEKMHQNANLSIFQQIMSSRS